MNLRFVEAFYWAVMLKSVTRASEKLFVTQSAMSSRIAALEEELGVLLLDRRDKQFRLTAAGARFHRHAERLLNLQREIRSELGSGGAARESVLRVGVIESVLHSWLIEWVQALRAEQPALQLELTVETTPVLMDQMRRGTADLVLAALAVEGQGIETRALAPMPMVFVGRKAGRMAGRRPPRRTLAELTGESELLTFQRGSQPHVALLAQCRKHGIDAPRVHCISSISAMVELVEQGFGIATLPAAAVARLALHRPLAAVRTDVELQPLPIHLSWRDDPATPLVARAAESALVFGRPATVRAASAARAARNARDARSAVTDATLRSSSKKSIKA
ncbi:MAG: LysR family transcriptional regulator [Burkholderiales bacterium]|nr:LysR family transcriptional regulator [Burkholderiales bacterium]